MIIYAKALDGNSVWTAYTLARMPNNGKLYWQASIDVFIHPSAIELPLYERDQVIIDGLFYGRAYEEGDLHARTL